MSNLESPLNHITNFFNSIGFTSDYHFNDKQKKLIENNKIDFSKILESDRDITITDASVKHSEIIHSLSKIFKMDINIFKLYKMYVELSKGEISFYQFLNYLIFINLIFENFHDIISDISLDKILKEKITIYEIESMTNNNLKLENMYKTLLNESDEETKNYICLIILIFIFSFCNKFYILGINSINLELFTKNVSTYNRFYVSHYQYSIILYLEMIIYSNLFLSSKGENEKYFKNTHSRNKARSLNQKNIKSNTVGSFGGNTIRNNLNFEKTFDIENCYFFDNNIIKSDNNEIYKTLVFQSYLKYYFFFHLSKNNIKLNINITIENPQVLLNYSSIDSICKIFSTTDDSIKKLNFENLNILTKINISYIFKSFIFDQVIINILGFNNNDPIKDFIINYDDIISKGRNFYFQEQASLNSNEFSSTFKYLSLEWDLLNELLIYYGKKKNNVQSYIFRFNTFKCNINKITKDIDLYFNYSTIKEKEIFTYFKKTKNFIDFINKVIGIIDSLQLYKQYNIGIRLIQNNFRSHQLKLYLQLYIKMIIDYVEEQNLKNYTIYEKKFENYNENMQCYLNDNSIKKKIKVQKFKSLFKKIKYPQLQFLSNFSNELTEDWDVIVISDNSKEFNLVRTYDDNKIFFYLSKDYEPSLTSTMAKDDSEYLKIIMYLSSNRISYENGMNLINSIRNDKDNLLSMHVTLICDRFYLENYFLMENKMKKYVKILYQIVDDIYLIAKNIPNEDNSDIKEYFNYDIYIADSFINVVNFHQYSFDKDTNYCTLVFEFLSVLSSCIELILYILKNKDIYIPRFIYMIRNVEDYYSFEYKQSNIFFKKIKFFNSLFSLNIKKSTPLFCILSKKAKTEYTQNNDNFYDVFLRLFLNLNKVVENQATLNQVFFQKIHKNIFYEYYDSFIPIAFSYESYMVFSDIFLSNNYLEISHGDLFDKCFILPFESKIKKEKILEIINSTQLTKQLIIFNFNFPNGYTFNKKEYTIFSFHKVDFLLDELNTLNIRQYKKDEIKLLSYIDKYLEKKNVNKENKNKILKNFVQINRKNDKFEIYFFEPKIFEKIIDNYNKEKMKIQTQKVEMRVFQLTEDAKNSQTKSKRRKSNDCLIF